MILTPRIVGRIIYWLDSIERAELLIFPGRLRDIVMDLRGHSL